MIPELVEENTSSANKEKTDGVLNNITDLQLDFWSNFVQYCKEQGRGEDIASRKPLGQSWYDVSVGKTDYHGFFNMIGKSTLRIGLYIYNVDAFSRLESKKDLIEQTCGYKMEWYTSRKNSVAKRVVYSTTTDLYDKDKYKDSFEWLINSFDKLKNALELLD